MLLVWMRLKVLMLMMSVLTFMTMMMMILTMILMMILMMILLTILMMILMMIQMMVGAGTEDWSQEEPYTFPRKIIYNETLILDLVVTKQALVAPNSK